MSDFAWLIIALIPFIFLMIFAIFMTIKESEVKINFPKRNIETFRKSDLKISYFDFSVLLVNGKKLEIDGVNGEFLYHYHISNDLIKFQYPIRPNNDNTIVIQIDEHIFEPETPKDAKAIRNNMEFLVNKLLKKKELERKIESQKKATEIISNKLKPKDKQLQITAEELNACVYKEKNNRKS